MPGDKKNNVKAKRSKKNKGRYKKILTEGDWVDKNKKAFSPGAILSVTHGLLLCELDELYEILGHLTGEHPHTHQILRFMRECEDYLNKTFPEIMASFRPVNGKDDALLFVNDLNEKFGKVLVGHMPDGIKHVSIDPVLEAEQIRGRLDGQK